ncbi:hypothetical protein AZE42_12879 [Rhizopogon vesiculosus]|uniref:Peptidase A1 domain-containing protein n=1 Tax=Rhizopogon vesiculosus TaxID=180088 RepID=A0A1J8QBT1_9AGAM|nr:hypothetical protein AZE42_12879 [Rhizopogon vesiculosus]
MVLSRSLSYLLLPALAFLSLSARASPYSRTIPTRSTAALKLAVKINANGIKNIAAADRARAQTFLQGGASSSISAVNDGLDYTAVIGVGSPPTYYTLLVDTGSSDTWIGASKPYTVTSTSVDTGGKFYVAYGTSSSQSVSGEEYRDTVTLNSGLVITNQFIGVAENGTNAGLGGNLRQQCI